MYRAITERGWERNIVDQGDPVISNDHDNRESLQTKPDQRLEFLTSRDVLLVGRDASRVKVCGRGPFHGGFGVLWDDGGSGNDETAGEQVVNSMCG